VGLLALLGDGLERLFDGEAGPTRVASWRVIIASSAVLAPRRNSTKRFASRLAFSVVSFTSSGSALLAQQLAYLAGGIPSSTPLLLRPLPSRALYSNAAISVFLVTRSTSSRLVCP
jgi:hypothetical protein